MNTLLITENSEYKAKNTKQRGVGGGDKAITLQPGAANCSFDDEVLDDKSNEDSNDCKNHEEEESALLVCQASSGSVRLNAGSGPRACCAAA